MAKRKKRKKRAPIDPQKQAQRKQKRNVRSVLERIGFSRIHSDNIEFKFDGRTGEIDDIFIMENVLLLCEYTIGKGSDHLAKKSILINKILEAPKRWITEYSQKNPKLQSAVDASDYVPGEFRIRMVYVSESVSDELRNAYPAYLFLYGNCLRYFEALTKTIHMSAAPEFLSFLKVGYSDYAGQVKDSSRMVRQFPGHLLPEAKSGYPEGTRIVSFYADPENLLDLSYVLRRDGWRDSEGLYQRILMKGKILKMRKYLSDEGRVFVNNIIVTLPPTTTLNHRDEKETNLTASDLTKAQVVTVTIPYLNNVIGLIDGQHRVFCYYKGADRLEKVISKVRSRQNLLVTGLILPERLDDEEKRRFEAKLFLEINDNQAKARSALKQSIELILSPFSVVAICKDVANRLSDAGALRDMLQTHHFDPPEKIKTTSIVSYGLRPLIKFSGNDSLFATWKEPNKERLNEETTPLKERSSLRAQYLNYSVNSINAFLVAAKLNSEPERWKTQKARKDRFLSPTVINGLLACMRRLAEVDKIYSDKSMYMTSLKPLKTFKFSRYRSSRWKGMGDDIFDECF